ncbi:MAG: HAD-IIA family hydrolase [Candidatus Limivivens sp.]|nr:HAD-IIA family hydrolase [Candidatus Limivivens sp.]
MIDDNQSHYSKLREKKLFLFDIDGTLALGDELLPGTREVLNYLEEHGKSIYFTTNNSTRSGEDFVKYFAQWGIRTREESFLTAGQMAILYCRERFADRKIFLLGTPSLRDALIDAGLKIVETYEEDIACVLVAFDTTLQYQKLADASRILQDPNVKFIATNPDLCCPTTFGAIPDCGSICMMLENAVGRKPLYIGKPAPGIVRECCRRSGCSKKETVLIGDRLYTDILCAENSGIDALIVFSGETTRNEAEETRLWIPYAMENMQKLADFFSDRN